MSNDDDGPVRRSRRDVLQSGLALAGGLWLPPVFAQQGNFDWKKFYKSLLKRLDDVLIDQKAKYRAPVTRRDEEGRLVFDERATKTDLSDAVFSAIEHRRPVAIIADEAQDLGIIASGRKLIDQMNRIKHLADTFKIPFVLAGTYELLKFRHLNG